MQTSKRLLSWLLTAVMALGCVGLLSGVLGSDPFGTKQTAEAASDYALVRQASVAGGYYRIDQTLRVNNVDSGVKTD